VPGAYDTVVAAEADGIDRMRRADCSKVGGQRSWSADTFGADGASVAEMPMEQSEGSRQTELN